MGHSINQPNLPTPLLLADVPVRMAKTALRKAENTHAALGKKVERVRELSGLNLQEFAKAIGRNERQVYRWINGTERPQLEAILAVEEFQGLVVTALAEGVPGVVVRTTITIERIA